MDSVTLLPLGFAIAGIIILAIMAVRRVRSAARARRRIIEAPNSHYIPPAAREGQTRHRWRDIALDRVHEINREEVVRLLARVEATGVTALSEGERTFLDHMAEITGVPREPKPRPTTGPAPDLRERLA